MALQSAIRFQDNVGGGNFVGLRAPAAVPVSYTLLLPADAPQMGQVLQAVTPTELDWVSLGGTPSISRIYYVSLDGDDANDGSFSAPFRTIKQGVTVANGVATLNNPVLVEVGAGLFVEDNSGGPISITNDGLVVSGQSLSSTLVVPTTPNVDLFSITASNTQLRGMTLASSGGSTAAAINLNSSLFGIVRFNLVGFQDFQTGLRASSASGFPIILMQNTQFGGNAVCLDLVGIQASVQSALAQGPFPIGAPANTFARVTGANGLLTMAGTLMRLFAVGVEVDSGGVARILSTSFDQNIIGTRALGGSECDLTGCLFTTNFPTSVNTIATGPGTLVKIEGTCYNCADSAGINQGTALQVFDQATLCVNSSSVNRANLGIEVGTPADTATTRLIANALSVIFSTNDIQQQGTSTLLFVAGSFDETKVSIADSTNISFAGFDDPLGESLLAIGTFTDETQALFEVLNGQPLLSQLTYNANYYGNKGVVYVNQNNNPTFHGIQSQSNNASSYVVTGDRTRESYLALLSDTGNFGAIDNTRGWHITKAGTTATLDHTYFNNDVSGQALRGSNVVMRLNGFDNQIEFPLATNAPLPTNTVARLSWAGDTNLYRLAAGVLRTDGNLSIGGLTASRVVVTDGSSQLASSATTSTELGFLSGVTSSIQTQLNNRVLKTGDTMTGSLTLPAGSAASPSLQFTGSVNTGLSAGVSNVLSFSTNGAQRMTIGATGGVSINQFSTAGVVHNNASGLLTSSLIVNADVDPAAAIADTKLATISTPGKVANAATSAKSTNDPDSIVLRDASGNFSAGIITATTFIGSFAPSGTLTLQAGSAAAPSLQFTGSVNTGLSAGVPNVLSFSTNGAQRMSIDATGGVSINQFSTAGVVHNSAAGLLTSSLIVDADVSPTAAIVDTKLATISTAGKVANSATSAQVGNVFNAIVLRDGVGNFSAGTITASLTGAASLNVLKAGDTMTGALILPAGTAAVPSLQFTGSTNTGLSAPAANTLAISTSGASRLNINSSGNVTYQNNYKLQAYRSTNQAVNNTTATIIFDVASIDTNSNYNTGTGIYTVPVTGTYLIAVTVTTQTSNQPSIQVVNIVRNGSPVTGASVAQGVSNNNRNQPITTVALVALTAGDSIRVDYTTDKSDTIQANHTHIAINYMSF